jgi:hypothetical protein
MRKAIPAGFSNVRPLKEAPSGRNPSAQKNGKWTVFFALSEVGLSCYIIKT